jgi:hypothetical protein
VFCGEELLRGAAAPAREGSDHARLSDRLADRRHSQEDGSRRDAEAGEVVGEAVGVFAWSAPDKEGIWRVVLCFAIELESFAFGVSSECIGYEFMTKQELLLRAVSPQIRPIIEWL